MSCSLSRPEGERPEAAAPKVLDVWALSMSDIAHLVDWYQQYMRQSGQDPVFGIRVHDVAQAPEDTGVEGLYRSVKVLAKRGSLDEAEDFAARVAALHGPALELYNSLIQGCVRTGDVERAEKYFLSMLEQDGLNPDIVTFNSILNVCAELGDEARAEQWFQYMLSSGIEASEVTYGTICRLFARMGKVAEIRHLMGVLESSGLVLNEHFYASLISACAAATPPDATTAELAVKEMVDRGLRVQSVSRMLYRTVGEWRAMEIIKKATRKAFGGKAAGPAASQCHQCRPSDAAQGCKSSSPGSPAAAAAAAGVPAAGAWWPVPQQRLQQHLQERKPPAEGVDGLAAPPVSVYDCLQALQFLPGTCPTGVVIRL